MAVGFRLVSLFTFSTLAVLLCSFEATSVGALSIEFHGARSFHRPAHEAIAKRKRSKRCKPRSIPSALPVTSQATPVETLSVTSQAAPAETTSKPKPTPSSSGNNDGSQGGNSNGNSKGNSNSTSANNGGGWFPKNKFGLGWPNGASDLSKWNGVSTIYTWSPSCPDIPNGLDMTCCPMLWGFNQVDQWKSQVMGSSPPCVMGMNEPEISGQSNMDVASGVSLWNQYVRPMKAKGAKLISPATTSDPAGKQWMQDFYNTCGGNNKCDVDFHACHWYDTTGDKLIAYLDDLYDTFAIPLMLTEFACQNFNGGAQCTMDQIWDLVSKLLAFLAQSGKLEVIMPFGAMHDMQGVNPDNQLMNSDGSPNALAKAYLSL